jgi:hypothetical protein
VTLVAIWGLIPLENPALASDRLVRREYSQRCAPAVLIRPERSFVALDDLAAQSTARVAKARDVDREVAATIGFLDALNRGDVAGAPWRPAPLWRFTPWSRWAHLMIGRALRLSR